MATRWIRRAAGPVTALILLALAPGTAADPPVTGPAKVVDGDTIDVQTRAGPVRIRLYGIDTPERGEPGYRAATDTLRGLLARGPTACAPRPGEVTYGRIVATCTVQGQDLALAQLRAGRAAPWCSYLSGDPLEAPYLDAAAQADGPPAKPRHRCPAPHRS